MGAPPHHVPRKCRQMCLTAQRKSVVLRRTCLHLGWHQGCSYWPCAAEVAEGGPPSHRPLYWGISLVCWSARHGSAGCVAKSIIVLHLLFFFVSRGAVNGGSDGPSLALRKRPSRLYRLEVLEPCASSPAPVVSVFSRPRQAWLMPEIQRAWRVISDVACSMS